MPKINRLDLRPYWAQLLPIKYAVFEGYVQSVSDGQRHRITAEQLMRCYGVKPSECVVIRCRDDERGRRDVLEALLHLRPRKDGNYELPVRWP